MATTNSTGRASQLLERLRGRFLQASGEPILPEDNPKRRGLAVTICILISSVLWFTFSMQETYTRVLQLPTRISNLPADAALAELPAPTARVEVRGSGYQLFWLYYDPPTIPIDASGEVVNLENLVPELSMPKNVQVLSVSPREIRLQKEQAIMRRIPVRLQGRIDTPPTHDFLTPPTLSPDSVAVAGARSVVNSLRFWPTVPFASTNVKDSITVEILLADTLDGLVTTSVDFVTLTTVARQFTEGRREIEVNVRGIPSTEQLVKLDPPVVEVRYRVLFEEYDEALRAPDFYAEVYYDEILDDTTGRVQPRLHLPPDLHIRDVEMIPPTLNYFQVLPE